MRLDWEMLESNQTQGRLYEWDGPWVSLGRNQDPSKVLTPGWQRWVQRPTGGGAVLHGHDLTVSIATPIASRKPSKVYETLLTPVIEALNACGLHCGIAGNQNKPTKSEDCFASTDRFDVVGKNGEKVCGCALRITRKGALLQMSIPYQAPLIDPREAIQGARNRPVPIWDYRRLSGALRSPATITL